MDALRDIPEYRKNRLKYNSILSVVEVIEDVTTEPLTLSEAKRYLKVDFTDEDADIAAMIKECREELEGELNLSLAVKTIKVKLVNQKGNIFLPYGPVISVVEVADYEGTVQGTTTYEINNGMLETVYDREVFVTYETGFSILPGKYLRMIKERVAFKYRNRGDGKLTNANKVWLI